MGFVCPFDIRILGAFHDSHRLIERVVSIRFHWAPTFPLIECRLKRIVSLLIQEDSHTGMYYSLADCIHRNCF